MKGLKEFFKMIVTAVICFTMSAFTRNQAEEKIVRVLSGGKIMFGRVGGNGTAVMTGNGWKTVGSNAFLCNNKNLLSGNKNNIIEFQGYRRRLRLKKMLRWFQGPGDSREKLFEASG